MDINSLHEHNREAYQKVMQHFNEGHQKACVVHATGTGKSYIIGAVAAHFNKILVVAPNNYVIAQVQSTVSRDDVDYITYMQLMSDADNKRTSAVGYDLIVFDEFHRTGAERWSEGVRHVMHQNPEARIFGTSATPVRYLDNGRDMAEELFDGQVVSTLTVQDAWVRGILLPPVYTMVIEDFNTISKDCLDKINSGYIPEDERPELFRQLEAAQKSWDLAGGVPGVIRDSIDPDTKRIIVFCPSIDTINEDRIAVIGWLKEAGIRVDSTHIVDSSRSDKTNTAEMSRFQQDGHQGTKVMFSVNMLNEGIHVPRVDAVIMLRRTVSMNIYLQQMGRCMTASHDNDKRPVILDLQNNIVNVGLNSHFSRWDDEYKRSVLKYGYTGESRNITVKGVAVDIMNVIQSIGNKFNDYRKNFDWNNNYAEAKAFFDEYGRFPSYKENQKLYNWANNWIKYYYLSNPEQYQQKAEMLTAVGFVYQSSKDRNDGMWMKNYEEAKAFYDEQGHFPRSNENNRLYQWSMAWWTRSYLKNPEENEVKAQMLGEIGFIYQPNEEKNLNLWWDNYEKAKAFYDKHGHFPSYKDDQKLYDWARNWWKKAESEHTDGLQEKIRLLKAVGFQGKEYKSRVETNDDLWMNNYNKAKTFYEENGRFPKANEDKALGQWARQWWRKTYLTNPAESQSKAQLLHQVGFIYRTAEERAEEEWMRNYHTARTFFDKCGHFPAQNEIEGLKKWARQWWTKCYQKSPDTHQQKAAMLKNIGFEYGGKVDKKTTTITDANVIKQGYGYAIRCKVDGIQQSASTLSSQEQKNYIQLLDSGDKKKLSEYLTTLAEKHFGGTGQSENLNKGLKR